MLAVDDSRAVDLDWWLPSSAGGWASGKGSGLQIERWSAGIPVQAETPPPPPPPPFLNVFH